MKSVFGRPRLAVRVMLCGLSGHRAMKGLRRERGERVVLRFTFHYCQPFVRTLASAHCTYVALGLDILYMCVCEHVCVYCIQYVNEGRPLYYDQRENTSNIHHNYFHLGNWTTTFPQRRQAYKKNRDKHARCWWWSCCTGWRLRMRGWVWETVRGRRTAARLTVVSLRRRAPVVFLWSVGEKASILHGVREEERRAKRGGESESRGLFVGRLLRQ